MKNGQSSDVSIMLTHRLQRDNQRKRYCNQYAVIGSKYLSGNNLPQISMIRGKLFADRYLHPIPDWWFQLRLLIRGWLSRGNRCGPNHEK